MTDETPKHRNVRVNDQPSERGSALVLSALITVLLALLGVTCLMMAQTETGLAENHRNGALALYVAEGGARLAVHWFNDPTPGGLLVPSGEQVDRGRRLLDHDGNSATARVLAAPGDPARPWYKDPVLASGAILDRPYGSAPADAFLGVESGTDPDRPDAGPDLVVSAAHLGAINAKLFDRFPSGALNARLSRIEIYAPPALGAGGATTRLGIATVRVVAEVFVQPGSAGERAIASRTVRAVINRLPIPGRAGALQSCGDLNWPGGLNIHWGTGSSSGNTDLGGSLDPAAETGLPYASNDPFAFIGGTETLFSWAVEHDGENIEDPWFRYLSGGAINLAPNRTFQPWPFAWPGSLSTDHSNLFQHTAISCPSFPYEVWKSIAQSGDRNHFYYAFSDGAFHLNGEGPGVSFEAATAGQSGLIFFDTADGLAPNDLPPTDPESNLTPAISVSERGWGTQGLVYLNARGFETNGAALGILRTVRPPGEPGDASGFVNLNYPGTPGGTYRIRQGAVDFKTFEDPETGAWSCTDAARCDAAARIPALSPVRDRSGLPFRWPVAVDGILYIGGVLGLRGEASYFGWVIARQGVVEAGGSPAFYFDQSLADGAWPRTEMGLPRVVIPSWQTGA